MSLLHLMCCFCVVGITVSILLLSDFINRNIFCHFLKRKFVSLETPASIKIPASKFSQRSKKKFAFPDLIVYIFILFRGYNASLLSGCCSFPLLDKMSRSNKLELKPYSIFICRNTVRYFLPLTIFI